MKANNFNRTADLLFSAMPASVRAQLFVDSDFCARIGVSPRLSFPLDDGNSFEIGSLHDALRKAVAGGRTASVKFGSGKQMNAKLGMLDDGRVTLAFGKKRYAFTDADLLDEKREPRIQALGRVLSARPLQPREEDRWREIGEERAFTDREFDDLMSAANETPESFRGDIRGQQGLNVENLIPTDPGYYHRLVAELSGSSTLQEFVETELQEVRRLTVKRHPARGLRRIAFSALWRPLVPFDLLGRFTVDDIAQLLAAEDPFSLLCGFEICQSRVSEEKDFVDLGTKFLSKLFGDHASAQSRCEVFCASSLITSVMVRKATKVADAPVFWARMVALAHAGVMTDALGELTDTKSFLDWSRSSFQAAYLWGGMVDRRESPRWLPEWISPDQLHAELVGRVQHSIWSLGEGARPAEWTAIYDSVVDRLKSEGRLWAAIFPGPFDDFQPSGATGLESSLFYELEGQLRSATRFADVSSLPAIAYALLPSGEAIANIQRLMTAMTNDPVSDVPTEVSTLRLVAHVGVIARSTSITDLVINRCFRLAHESEVGAVTDLFAIMLEACAVVEKAKDFREAVGDVATNLCSILRHSRDLENMGSAFGLVIQRDPKLAAALARAMAILQTKLRRN